MKKILLVAIIVLINDVANAQSYSWYQRANFGGGVRYAAFGFAIGNKGYIGSGITHVGTSYTYHHDFWEYDPANNLWTQKANLPGPGRSSGTGFTIGQKGYVTVGWTPTATTTTYEYDPVNNSWTLKANFGGSGRYDVASFTISDFAYVGCGYAPYSNDFWRYDPIGNVWTQIADCGNQNQSACKGFTIGNYGYVVAGGRQFSYYSNELWRYDPPSNSWLQMADIPGPGRAAPGAFALNGYGYVGAGCTGSLLFNDFYRYDPLTDTWITLTNIPWQGKIHPVCFSIGTSAFVGTGADGIYTAGNDRAEFWEYAPTLGITENDAINMSAVISPNPIHDVLTLKFKNRIEDRLSIWVYESTGKLILKKKLSIINNELVIANLNWESGVYIIEIFNKNQTKIFSDKFIVE